MLQLEVLQLHLLEPIKESRTRTHPSRVNATPRDVRGAFKSRWVAGRSALLHTTAIITGLLKVSEDCCSSDRGDMEMTDLTNIK